jgi:putative acetyltransferase
MIRKYQDTDLNELLEAWYSASKVAHHFLDKAFFKQEREAIASVYLPVSETWVFEEGGKVISFISLLENEVGGLFVHADHHRKGIGKQLMDFAANLKGALVLDVFEENGIGRTFYKKYGFVEVETFFDKETQQNQVRMALS